MRFDAVLEASDDGDRWVRCPFDGREVLGEARPPVAGTVNGTAFRGRLAVYGGSRTWASRVTSGRRPASTPAAR
jgi:hypothetical protein